MKAAVVLMVTVLTGSVCVGLEGYLSVILPPPHTHEISAPLSRVKFTHFMM